MLTISDESLWEGLESAQKEDKILDATAVGGALDALALAGPSREEKRQREVCLVQSVKEGDQWAFAQLLTECWSSLMSICINYVRDHTKAEEVAYQAANKVWQNREKLDPFKNFRGFLLKTATFCCLDFLRLEKSHQHNVESLDALLENPEGDTITIGAGIPDPTSEDFVERFAAREAVQMALSKLSESHRILLLLHYFSGYSRKEIAEIQECSEQNVGHHVRKALSEFERLYLEIARDQQNIKRNNNL